MKTKTIKLRGKTWQRKNVGAFIVQKLYQTISSNLPVVMIAGIFWLSSSASAAVLVDTGTAFTKGFGGQPIISTELAVDDFQVQTATTITRVELLMFTINGSGSEPTIRVQITDAIGPGATEANLIAEYTATVGSSINFELAHFVSIPMNLPLQAGSYYLVVSSNDDPASKHADWVVGAPNGTPGQGMQARQAEPYSFVDSVFPPASQFFDILPSVNYSFRIITEDAVAMPVVNDVPKIFFSNLSNDTILRANLDGSAVETLVAGQYYVFSTDVDRSAGKLYWTELQMGVPGTTATGHWASIKRSNLDGTDMELILTKGHGVKHPTDIKLDPLAGKLYWADGGGQFIGGRIYRANLDGSNVELLIDVLSLRAPGFSLANGYEFSQVWGLALDISAGQFYWTDYFAGDIHRALLDGSTIEQLVAGQITARGIALDHLGGMMYWATGNFGNEIVRGDMNGGQADIIVNKDLGTKLKQPFNVSLDESLAHVYWTDMDTGRIQRSDLAGLDVVTLVEQGVFRKGKFKADSIAGLSLNLPNLPVAPTPAPAPSPVTTDLGISVSSTLNTITVGDSVTYTLMVSNTGSDLATGVVLTSNLSAAANILSSSVNCNTVANAINCNLGNLTQGATGSVDITVSSDVVGILSNSVSVSAVQPDSNLTNNSLAFETVVNPGVPVNIGNPDLTAQFSKLRTNIKKGLMNVEVEADIQNTGSAGTESAFSVKAYFSTDTLLDANDQLLQTWNISALAPADTAVVKTRNSLLPASGWIIIIVDPDSSIDETDENNNTSHMAL